MCLIVFKKKGIYRVLFCINFYVFNDELFLENKIIIVYRIIIYKLEFMNYFIYLDIWFCLKKKERDGKGE